MNCIWEIVKSIRDTNGHLCEGDDFAVRNSAIMTKLIQSNHQGILQKTNFESENLIYFSTVVGIANLILLISTILLAFFQILAKMNYSNIFSDNSTHLLMIIQKFAFFRGVLEEP